MIDDFRQMPTPEPVQPDSPTAYELPRPQTTESTAQTFQTPETVATAGGAVYAPNDGEHTLPAHTSGGTNHKIVRLFGKWPVSRKKLIIAIVILVILLASGAAFALTHSNKKPVQKAAPTAKIAAPVAPPPITSPLTGLTVDSKAKTTLPVIGAMIENSGDARPQSGLKDAGVVYEAIAEAGITRFLALYQENHPGNIGPIRSSRPYYLDWAMAFDASYAHVGGSPDALARIKAIGVHDMDQFYNAEAYHRITTRYAPHNVYTSVDQLTNLSVSKGWDTSRFTPFSRKADKPYVKPVATTATPVQSKSTSQQPISDARTPANSINFSISGDFYNAHYDYDPTTNLYKRSEGGAPHMDADSNTQLTPKVVIALVMPYSLMDDGYHSQYNTMGTGKMFVFQDGTVTAGTWSKGEPKTQFEFKDDGGKTLSLDAGQTWISVVADAGKVSYQ